MASAGSDETVANRGAEHPGHGTAALVVLATLATAGVLLLFYFTGRLLMVGRLGSLSLPLVAVVGGVASTFNPCALPALPGFLVFCGGPQQPARRRAATALAAGGGALLVVTAILAVASVLGMQAQMLVAPSFGWVQVCGGLFMILLAAAHLINVVPRVPLIAMATVLGGSLWEAAVERPNPAGAFLFGAGFLAVGGT